jgi:dTDP-4-dehydrorhamnose reductase
VSGWLVTGAAGGLGTDVVDVLRAYGEEVAAFDHAGLDITDRSAVTSHFATVQPAYVVNCAAYTDVDAAEDDEDAAYAVNATGPALLADACRAVGARLVHVSAADVFTGEAEEPYDEGEPTAPRSAYGRTKAAGEQAVLASGADGWVVRTSWLYGQTGDNVVKALARLAARWDKVPAPDDRVGTPTWTLHVARALVGLAVSDAPAGVLHCAAEGEASPHVFARAVFAELGLDPARVEPLSSATKSGRAPRPNYTVLSTVRWRQAGLPELPHWRDSLHEAFETLGGELAD